MEAVSGSSVQWNQSRVLIRSTSPTSHSTRSAVSAAGSAAAGPAALEPDRPLRRRRLAGGGWWSALSRVSSSSVGRIFQTLDPFTCAAEVQGKAVKGGERR